MDRLKTTVLFSIALLIYLPMRFIISTIAKMIPSLNKRMTGHLDLHDGTEYVFMPLTFAKFCHKWVLCLRKLYCCIFQEIPTGTNYLKYLKNKVYVVSNNKYELRAINKIINPKQFTVLLSGCYS
eukprot:477797_1